MCATNPQSLRHTTYCQLDTESTSDGGRASLRAASHVATKRMSARIAFRQSQLS